MLHPAGCVHSTSPVLLETITLPVLLLVIIPLTVYGSTCTNMHCECTQEKLPVDNCMGLGGHSNHQTCSVSTPCARLCKSMVGTPEALLFAFFCLRGVLVGVVYAGNNVVFKCSPQGLKWVTGRYDHRTPLTMTVPAQSHIHVYKALADLTLFLLLQICDLGSARRLDQTVKQTMAIRTYAWMAPEVRVSTHWTSHC